MPVSQSDIDALNSAIASGARSVTLNGQTVTYNTTQSLIQARDDLVRQLRVQTGVAGRPKRTFAYYTGRGFQRDDEGCF